MMLTLPLVFVLLASALIYLILAARLTRPHISAYDVDTAVYPTVRAKFIALDDPALGTDEIEYEVTEQGPARLVVTDVTGRLMTTVVDGEAAPGRYRVRLDLTTLPAGTYLYVLQTPTRALGRRMRAGR